MAKRLNLKEVLASGTPRQKALLIIQNQEASVTQEGAFLTDAEVQSIGKSVLKNDAERRELKLYLDIAERYESNRFRLYGLQENLMKLTYLITGYCQLWEMAEKQAEFSNVLLGLIDSEGVKNAKIPHKADVERYIYQNCRSWHRYTPIKRKKDKDGNELREVEVDISTLLNALDGIIAHYKSSLAVAKAFVIASDEFVAKYHASAFVPEDIQEMIKFFKLPNRDVPEIYRRDAYLELVKAKGEDDREVQYRKKYAILPAWEEVEPRGLKNAREAFSL